MSKLVIVESPAKARTINRYLGKGYTVKACMGHVRDLPEKRMGVDLEKDFKPEYELLSGRKKVISSLRKAADKAEEIYLATDLDREGEAIAWHLANALGLEPEKTRRVVFNEITRSAIQAAFGSAHELDLDKVNAQQARRILDRIVGYRLSPLLWRKLSPGLSAGRVQSVAVRLIVEREREIRAFTPEEFWRLTAKLAPPDRHEEAFEAELKKVDGEDPKIGNEKQAGDLVEELQKAPYVVTRYKPRKRSQKAPPPFITSTMQQQGSTLLRFSTKRTMRVAQQLYEGIEIGAEGAVGLITYMRTDSLRVSDQALDDCRETIQSVFGDKYLPEKPHFYRSRKGAQGAHEAIRPTSAARKPEDVKEYLSPDQLRLYELIWKRFVASQMRPAEWSVADVEVTAGRGLLAAQGKTLTFDGFLKVAGFNPKDEVRMPVLEEGRTVDLLGLDPSQHFTKPPPRYTEASLVRTLEKLGIGRPSTYSPIISTIQDRRYVRQEKRQFFATELGETVNDQLVKHFPDIMNVEFTSTMEEKLDKIEEQHRDWVGVLRDFYEPFRVDLERANKEMSRPEPEPTDEKCPECGKPLLKRWSRRGSFLGCAGYPECKYTRDLPPEGQAGEALPEIDEKCPECGKPLTVRRGRRGPFVGCTGYPNCTFTRNVEAKGESGEPLPEIKEDCPDCGKPLTVRRGRRGPFVGCTGYPDCKYTRDLTPAPEAPPDAVCEECGKPMAVRRGRRGFFLGCTGYPKCRNTKPMPDDKKDTGQKKSDDA